MAAIKAGEAGHRHCRRTVVAPGDTLMLRPGTLHAIGPGALVYEIEQPSDITFRISDWGRVGRQLHIAESQRALHPERHAEPVGVGFRLEGGVLTTETFCLELATTAAERRPAGRSPDVVTALVGGATLRGDGWEERLREWETVVVPASSSAYELVPDDGAVTAIASLP
jgi:mannose-6-phosphate isomerase